MSSRRVLVVGGGAAGFFAAITCAESSPENSVVVLEKGPQFLSKVRISGGGRCNVTHACFEPRELAACYPRGGDALLGPLHLFQPRDTVRWFESHGVELNTETDGRMFPATNSSQTVIDCLVAAAREAGVRLQTGSGVEKVFRRAGGGFEVTVRGGGTLESDRLMLATGGCRGPAAGHLAVALGHTLAPPVPSLFTFHVAAPWLSELAGISLECVEVSVPETKLREQGPALITHEGLSGPAILRLSAWGARTMHAMNYRFALRVNWLPRLGADALSHELDAKRKTHPARLIVNTPLSPIPARLWEALVMAAGIPGQTRWADLSRASRHRLVQQLAGTRLEVTGKSLNQEEFVTCGGVPLAEVNLKTMESRICPGLFFGGELLNVDGITGGFNFQAAWTTGWIAAKAMGQ